MTSPLPMIRAATICLLVVWCASPLFADEKNEPSKLPQRLKAKVIQERHSYFGGLFSGSEYHGPEEDCDWWYRYYEPPKGFFYEAPERFFYEAPQGWYYPGPTGSFFQPERR